MYLSKIKKHLLLVSCVCALLWSSLQVLNIQSAQTSIDSTTAQTYINRVNEYYGANTYNANYTNIICVRGEGSDYRLQCGDKYDDLFIVVKKNGECKSFTKCSLEGTVSAEGIKHYGYDKFGVYDNYYYEKYDVRKFYTPAIINGIYTYTYEGSQLRVKTVDGKGVLQSWRMDGSDGDYLCDGILVHKGYENVTPEGKPAFSCNGSTGCLTVYKDDYNDFIRMFTSEGGYIYIIGEDPMPKSTPKPAPPSTPTTVKPTPTTVKPTPTKAKPTPTTVKPTPTKAKPTPTTVKPTPTKAKPTPTTAKPTPTKAKPTPTTVKPTPTKAKPTPTTVKPTPTKAKPTPTTVKPTPTKAKPTPTKAKPTPTTIKPTATKIIPTPTIPSKYSIGQIHVTYQVYDNVKKKWLPNVTDTQDYAGIYGNSITGIYANLSKGNIIYKVHYKGATSWLPAVTNRTDYAGILSKPIDGLMMTTDTGRTIHYQVHLKESNTWLPYVTGYDEKDPKNGYAGILGQEIDAVRIYID